MLYKGYDVRLVDKPIPATLGKTKSLAIFLNERRMAYVDGQDFSKHVIDVKIAEGAWPDLSQADAVQQTFFDILANTE